MIIVLDTIRDTISLEGDLTLEDCKIAREMFDDLMTGSVNFILDMKEVPINK